MKTSEKIIEYIRKNGQASGNELADFLEISDRAVRKQLASLLEKDILHKVGKPPKVFYLLKNQKSAREPVEDIDEKTKKEINEKYLFITAAGRRLEGFNGFRHWCAKQNLPLEKTVREYIRTAQKYDDHKRQGFIDGLSKIKKTFSQVHLDKLFYLDFYSIERFGKTRLGQLLLYAKQSQDKKLMKELIVEIKPRVDAIISKYGIDGIGYIPPTVKREVQLMKVLEKGLKENIRAVKIVKLKTQITVPQKTLNKLPDRIENAENTFVIEDNSVYKNILLLDDAVGSGATMNEIAGKIRYKKICRGRIIGLAITGSFKGFDVISEV